MPLMLKPAGLSGKGIPKLGCQHREGPLPRHRQSGRSCQWEHSSTDLKGLTAEKPSTRWSFKYTGPVLYKALGVTTTNTLNWAWNTIRSCSSHWRGIPWWNLFLPVSIRSAMFCALIRGSLTQSSLQILDSVLWFKVLQLVEHPLRLLQFGKWSPTTSCVFSASSFALSSCTPSLSSSFCPESASPWLWPCSPFTL